MAEDDLLKYKQVVVLLFQVFEKGIWIFEEQKLSFSFCTTVGYMGNQ